MPSPLKWQAAATAVTLEANGSGLANNTIVEMNDIAGGYDNITGLNTIGWIEITGTWAVAPTDAAPMLSIYSAMSLGGANYQDPPVTDGVDCGHTFVISIPVRKVTTAQRLISQKFPVDPAKIKFYLDNQTGQSLGATWTATLYVDNLEGK